jgi:hypothetical protein
MKRSLLIGGLIAGAFLLPTLASAGVSGTCSTCHTMHDSQNNAAMGDGGGPYDRLLKGDGCAACHTGGTNDASTGRDASQYGAPQVDDSATPTSGGYFDTAAASDYAHNVTDSGMFAAADANMGTTPPGSAGAYSREGSLAVTGFNCSDCHDATGGHHGTAASYRMLSGVTGTGDVNFGVTGRSANAYTSSIDAFCATCHGDFHSNGNQQGSAAGIWKRHPTGIALAGTTIDTGFTGTDEVVLANDGGSDLVSCLSCHLPHGGPNPDLLSYNYTAISASDGSSATGCELCHNQNFDF